MDFEITSGKAPTAVKVVVYGAEGVGKSTFASRFPMPVFIDTEDSTANMDVRRLPKPADWQTLRAEVEWCIEHPEQVGTVVIDSVDWAESLLIPYICANNLIQGKPAPNIEAYGYGKGYTLIKDEFQTLLTLLSIAARKGINVVLTAHSRIVKFEMPDQTGSYDRYELKLSKQVAPLVKEWADMLLFAHYDATVVRDENGKAKGRRGTERLMETAHAATWDAKNRHGLEAQLPFRYESIAECVPVLGVKPEVVDSLPTDAEPKPKARKKKAAKADGVPGELFELMEKDGIYLEEIMNLCHERFKVPKETPFEEYPADWVKKNLIDHWDKVKQAVEDERDLPF